MKTNQPNTPEEQTAIRRAVRLGTPVEMNALGNPPDKGWVEVDLETGDQPDFNYLRYRIKETVETPQPTATSRELLAIMSAIIFVGHSGLNNTPQTSVTVAKQILHEIDTTTR